MTCTPPQNTKFSEQIKVANALFKRLSPDQRRVEIAKDVIKSLKLKKIKEKTGIYVTFKSVADVNDESNMLEVVESTRCDCCARGAMFVSAVRKFDNVLFKDVAFENVEYRKHLDNLSFDNIESEYWDDKQIQMIEKSFESNQSFVETNLLSDDEISTCRKFARRYSTPEKRMIGIMRNIIRNKGTFRP